jgi:DNA-directed RNA polymerase specialized sigma24 family protein
VRVRPISRIPSSQTLNVLLTYGAAYSVPPADAANALLRNSTAEVARRSARRAAATAIKEYWAPLTPVEEIENSTGADGLDAFVVALATNWGVLVARRDFHAQQADAEDVAASVGATLLRVMRNAEQGPWMTQPPLPPALGDWTKTSVRRVMARRNRHRAMSYEDLVEPDVLAVVATTVGLGSDLEFIDVLSRVPTGALNTTDREVIHMVSHLGLTQVEVASTLGVSPQAVNQRLARIKVRTPELAIELAAP